MKDRKGLMLFVILIFAIIVGRAKRLRKLIVQEEGFMSSFVDFTDYNQFYLFSKFNGIIKLEKNIYKWWNHENEFLFDALFVDFSDYNHSFKENMKKDILLKELYKLQTLSIEQNPIGNFFTKIANEPISICFDVTRDNVKIRDTLKLDNNFKNVVKASFHQKNINCKYDEIDNPEKTDEEKKLKRIFCNPNSIPFYEILTWDCEYTTRHREMIGRIPDEIRYSYEPVTTDTCSNFGFLRFDHMIEWLNFYNRRLYGDRNENTITSTSKCSDDQSTKKMDAQNELIDDIYMFIESETDFDKFKKLLFDNEDNENKYNGILYKNHYNILRELQFDNMIFVNSVFADIVVKKKNRNEGQADTVSEDTFKEPVTVIDKKSFVPLLSDSNMYSMIINNTNMIQEMIRTKIFLDSYASKSIQRPEYKESVTSAFLQCIGFWHIRHLLHPEKENTVILKENIVKKIDKIEKQYLPVILVLKDGYETIHIFKDEDKVKLENLIQELTNSIKSPEKQYDDFLDHVNDLYDKKLLSEKEKKKIIKNKIFQQNTIFIKDIRLISSNIEYRINKQKVIQSYYQEEVFKHIFDDFNREKLRALLKSMMKVLIHDIFSSKFDDELFPSKSHECNNDISDMDEKIIISDTGITMEVNNEEVFKRTYQNYQKSINMSIMQIGFKVFLLEFAHHLANNKSTNLVGDISSLSRTARSSYELKDSLDLGDFYY